jgi:hypothetical protein
VERTTQYFTSQSLTSSVDQCGMDQIIEVLEKRPATRIHVFQPSHNDPDAAQRDLLADTE